jgi:MFS transporter, DHA1 family, tetracycline resistance protein
MGVGRGTQETPESGRGDDAAPENAPSADARMPRRRSATLFILITVLLDSAALGVIFPALPQLVRTLGVGAAASTAEIIGFLAIAFAGMQFLASPIQGALSDRFGRRPIILASNFGLGIDYLIMALAPNFPWLFVGRLISGVAAGSTSAAYAYVADVSTPEERATRFGYLQAAFALGYAIWPAIGGFLVDFVDVRAPFWVAAGLSLANAAYGVFILPESLPKERRARLSLSQLNPFEAIASLLRAHPRLIGILTPSFLMYVISTGLFSFAAVYTTYRFRWSGLHIGLYLLVLAAGVIVAQAGLVTFAVKRVGERVTAVGGMLLQTAALVAAGWATNDAGFWWAVPLMCFGAVANPAWSAIGSRSVGPNEQGRFNGAVTGLAAIAGVVGPGLFAEVYVHSAGAKGNTFMAGAPFFVAGGLALTAALFAFWATRRHAAPAA